MNAAAPRPDAPTPALRRAAAAVARAHGLRSDPLGTGLLSRGPEVLECVVARWVTGKPADAFDVALRHDLDFNLATALLAAVADLDPHSPEVEIARLWSAMPAEVPARAAPARPLPVQAAPRPAAPLPALPASAAVPGGFVMDDTGDAGWFIDHPERSHRLRPVMDGWMAVRLLDLAGGPVPLAMPVPGDRAGLTDEDAAVEAFGDAAVAWLAAERPCPFPERDRAWFSDRPARRHRLRTPLQHEAAGRAPAPWTTLVGLHHGRVLAICLDEAGLPPGDRDEAWIAAAFRVAAASLAAAAALSVPPPTDEPAGTVQPIRVAGSRLAPARGPLRLAAPVPALSDVLADADGEDDADGAGLPVPADEAGLPALLGRKHLNGGGGGTYGAHESWEERSALRAQVLAWPCMRVDEAFDVLEDLVKANGTRPFRPYDVRQACRRFTGDGAAGAATLKAYGLTVAGGNGMVRLSELASRCLQGTRASRSLALAEAAMSPAGFATILTDLGPRPGVEDLRAHAVTKGMTKADVAALHERYVAATALKGAAAVA